jgi:hypothetical protein
VRILCTVLDLLLLLACIGVACVPTFASDRGHVLAVAADRFAALAACTRASSGLNSCALPEACAARPPLAAIARCLSWSIEAKPRLELRDSGQSWTLLQGRRRRQRQRPCLAIAR